MNKNKDYLIGQLRERYQEKLRALESEQLYEIWGPVDDETMIDDILESLECYWRTEDAETLESKVSFGTNGPLETLEVEVLEAWCNTPTKKQEDSTQ